MTVARQRDNHSFMKYFVNLVLILQEAFQIAFEGQCKRKVRPDIVDRIVCEFCSEREGPIHNAIVALVEGQLANQDLPTSNGMMGSIRSLLIDGIGVRNSFLGVDLLLTIHVVLQIKNDEPITQTKPLPSLLTILRIAVRTSNVLKGCH